MSISRYLDWKTLIKLGALHRAKMDHAPRTLADWNASQNSEELTDLNFLIVDDNRLTRLMVKEALLTFGLHHFAEEKTAFHGLSYLQRKHADVVVISMSMGQMSGAAFATTVRGGGYVQNPQVPIIAISRTYDAGGKQDALAAGISEIIDWPICPQNFIKGILRTSAPPAVKKNNIHKRKAPQTTKSLF